MADDIRAWLADIGFEKYTEAFAENDIDFDVLKEIGDDELREIGVSLGDRKRLLRKIREADTATTSAPRQDAERRQLTVMFCDLVGSTQLSQRLDPEDLRDLMRRYQDAVSGAVSRYGGYVAKYLGDGVLAYFGWPQAYEDQAERAVRAGLEAIEAVGAVAVEDGAELQARVGIASGQVVVGDLIGEGGMDAEAVTGETPNLAARLQGVAETNQVVVGSATHDMLQGTFDFADLGDYELKGFAQPVPAWRVIGDSAAESRFEAMSGAITTPMFGRDKELAKALEAWHQAQAGHGQTVLISGDAGIGKSRLAQAVNERIGQQPHIRLRYQCSPYHANSAFHPVIQQLRNAAGFANDDGDEEKLDKLEALLASGADNVGNRTALIANLLSLPIEDRYGGFDLPPQTIKQQTMRALLAELIALSTDAPILFMFEDAHWVDPTTQELLLQTIDEISDAAVLVVISHRPEWQLPDGVAGKTTTITLDRLEAADNMAIVRALAGDALSSQTLEHIVTRTDGVPLFVEELTKSLIESGDEHGDSEIPATLQALLLSRLDRLGPDVKELVQLGAVIGRYFPYSLMARMTGGQGGTLAELLDHLTKSELVFRNGTPPDAAYMFKHALVQDAAYQSLLRSTRQDLHGRIADILSDDDERTADELELIAHHFTEAGRVAEAITYWEKAGQHAVQSSANIEAERHLRRGLALLPGLADAAVRRRLEMSLQNSLGVCLMPIKGFGDDEIDQTFTRAVELAEIEGDRMGRFVALRGKGQYHMISGNIALAKQQATHLLTLSKEFDDRGMTIEAHHIGWGSKIFSGDLHEAYHHSKTAISLYQRDRDHELTHIYSGHDPCVCAHCFGSLALWQLGLADQSWDECTNAQDLAFDLEHAFTTTVASWMKALLLMLRRDTTGLAVVGDFVFKHCHDKGFAGFAPLGQVFSGAARAADDSDADALTEMRKGFAGVRASGMEYSLAAFYAWLVECHLRQGDFAAAHMALAEGTEMAQRNSDKFVMSEFLRLRGELLLATDAGEKEAVLALHREAVDCAHGMEAKMLELRAANALAKLLGEQGRREEAGKLLSPLYDQFTEGFDTVDLLEAKSLIGALK